MLETSAKGVARNFCLKVHNIRRIFHQDPSSSRRVPTTRELSQWICENITGHWSWLGWRESLVVEVEVSGLLDPLTSYAGDLSSPLLCLTLLLPGFIRTFPVVNTGFMLSVHHLPSLTALLVSLRDLCLAPFCFLVWRLLSTTLPRHMQSIFSSTWIIPHIITWSWHSAQTADFLLTCKSEALLFHTCLLYCLSIMLPMLVLR